MLIRTQLRYRNLLFQDRFYVSELELLHAKSSLRPVIIASARRIGMARVLNAFRRYTQAHPPK